MTESEDFKLGEEKGLVLGKLEILTQAISHLTKTMDELKAGIGSRVQAIEERVNDASILLTGINKDLGNIGKSVDNLEKIRNWVGAIIALAIIGALFKLIFK